MKTIIFTLVVLTLIVNISFAQLNTENLFKAPFISAGNSQQSPQSIMQNSEKDIVFIENLGQIRDSKGNKRPDILFLTRSQGVDMYITSTGITYVFRKTEGDIKDRDNIKDVRTSLYRLDMEFVGMNKNIEVKKEFVVEQQFNYYTPEYPNGISTIAYKKVTLLNIYEGIDLVYYEKEGKMKYDFIVKAGADANKIRMKYNGAGKIYLDKNGGVLVTTPLGEIKEDKPYTYSRNSGIEIESRYKIKDNVVLFKIAEYNKSEVLIIDPYCIWATYYGGNDWDRGYCTCEDNLGNLYVAGYTWSTDFPIQMLAGAFNQSYLAAYEDAFILKFNSSGARIWATYYGGNLSDIAYSISTDNSNNLYVTGVTSSINFPIQTLPGAYNQFIFGGYFDAFLLKFNSSGARLWATFYGGSEEERGRGICIDNSGNLYVTGITASANFPKQTLPGAYNQMTFGGYSDAFLLKFDSSGARIWATFYGGNSEDWGEDICIDDSSNLYVTGTASSNFPIDTLSGAYNQTTHGGSYDIFILKFDSNSTRLWATYYGGSGYDNGHGICTDNSSNLYLTGRVISSNFPIDTLSGAYNQTTHGGSYDAFILKFNNSGARVWATYYGGSAWDLGNSICTDSSDNLYVTGETRSTNFPTQLLPGAYNQVTSGGIYDVFILKFDSSSTRIWATYYGGSNTDEAFGICADNLGNLYVTGYTHSTNFPTQILQGAYNDTTGGGSDNSDVFILKFSSIPVEIKNIYNEIPAKYFLYQNYPNPFNPFTNIRFDIPTSSFVKITIYNLLGKEITNLVNEKLSAGSYEVNWDALGYPSGVYFYKLVSGDFVEVKKMVLVK